MSDEEIWPLQSALAIVRREPGGLVVRLQGALTAPAYEALHLRMAAVKVDLVRLVIDYDALLLMTPRSALEAATRGTPAARSPRVLIEVPAPRLPWAQDHCRRLAQLGLHRQARVLERLG